MCDEGMVYANRVEVGVTRECGMHTSGPWRRARVGAQHPGRGGHIAGLCRCVEARQLHVDRPAIWPPRPGCWPPTLALRHGPLVRIPHSGVSPASTLLAYTIPSSHMPFPHCCDWTAGQRPAQLSPTHTSQHTYMRAAHAHMQATQPTAALIERQALLDIFRQCGGSSWKSSRGWGSAEPVHTWERVECDSDGRVVRLKLSWNDLRGAK
jgi:hypothetical protein